MSRTIVLPNPDAVTTIGASLSFQRVASGVAGVLVTYNPANGDTPFETTALVLTTASRNNLVTILNEIDAAMKTARGYTP